MSNPTQSSTNTEGGKARYAFQEIEAKWQERWARHRTWEVTEDPARKKDKYYTLVMFPYPSGRLHMGHVRNYTISDVIVRFRRAQGHHVLSPMGWDAFGLPAENAALKKKVHPEKWTLENIQAMKRQIERLGIAYDWSREFATCLPDYYKWEQLFFVQMYKRGLAYRKGSTVNWCPSCATVLANEQVEDGRCWRCESETTTRELEQWFLKTTQYAPELLEGLDTLTGWPERVRSMQRHWIGRSEGTTMQFGLSSGGTLEIFTTRPDTLFGVTYVAVAAEHPLALELSRGKAEERTVRDFVEKCRKQDKISRTAEDAPKEGVFTGSHAVHPLTGEKVPVYVANFVLMDYGTGALMAVPAHDTRDHAFAKKYGIPIREVIRPVAEGVSSVQDSAYTEAGILVNSGRFDGVDSESAKKAITEELARLGKGKATVTYRLRDWGLSRQRYWGAPIPMIYCEGQCGIVPVPEKDLPVVLPKDVEFTGEGGSPLAKAESFVRTTCPQCGGKARRETDTMDTFMESSWYYLRYCSPKETERPFDPKALSYWLGVDQYIGGIEHATMHLLYFRFFHKVLRDLGYIPEDLPKQDRDEPVRNLLNQGIVYKDGAKMSKSKGNVVEPDTIIGEYGADTARLFSMFAAPPEKVLEWSEQGVEGAYRFLGRVWRMVHNHLSIVQNVAPYSGRHGELTVDANRKLRAKTHETIAKVQEDFVSGYRFNTAIAAIMELVNEIYGYTVQLGTEENRAVLREAMETVIRLLHPFAPHVTEELWELLGATAGAPKGTLLAEIPLPTADADALKKDVITVVVQVNGKLRANIEVGVSLEKDKIIALAQEDQRVANHMAGKTVVKTIFVPGKLVNFVVK